MSIVRGMVERVQGPLYDSVYVAPKEKLRDVEGSGTIRFFVNVQNKTKLETNLQSASLLPHYNTFEARAMRVVISDLPPEFPDDISQVSTDFAVLDAQGAPVHYNDKPVLADLDLSLDDAISLLRSAKDSDASITSIDLGDDDIISLVHTQAGPITNGALKELIDAGSKVDVTVSDLEEILDSFDTKDRPLDQQLSPNNGSGTLIGKIVYNTVISLYVGEKLMIQMPTWFFPGGAGPFSETASITTHGTPSPQDTFRFAEPVYIDKQQNFRVEMEIPNADVLKDLQRIYGPLYIWVVLDGYMTRGVQ